MTTLYPGISSVSSGISDTVVITGGGGSGGPTLVNVEVGGTTDQAPIITAAYNAAATLQWRTLYLPAGRISIQTPIIPVAGITLAGIPGQTILAEDHQSFIIQAHGSIDITQGVLLATDTDNTLTINLIAGKSAALTVGTWNLLVSEASMPRSAQKQAEYIFIEDITGDTVTIAGPLHFTYLTSDTAQIFPTVLLDGLRFQDIIFESGNQATITRLFCDMEFCLRFVFERCTFRHCKSPGLYMNGCVEGACNDCIGYDLESNDLTAFGYFNVEVGPCRSFTQRNAKVERCRHGYTTGGGGNAVGGIPTPYGVPMDSRIFNGVHLNPRAAGWDTHPGAGIDIEFRQCTTNNGKQSGFQARSVGTRIIDCTAIDTIGPAVYATSDAQDTRIQGLLAIRNNLGIDYNGFDWRNYGAIFDNGVGTDIKDCKFEDSGGPAILVDGGRGGIINDNIIVDPLRLAFDITQVTTAATAAGSNVLTFATGNSSILPGMFVTDTTTGGVIPANTIVALDVSGATVALSANVTGGGVLSGDSITFSAKAGLQVNSNDINFDINVFNNRISCSDTAMRYGVYQSRTVPFTWIYNNIIDGAQTTSVLAASGRIEQITGNTGTNLISAGASVVTISGGILDVTNIDTTGVVVVSSTGLADSFDTITGGISGDIIILGRSASVNITLLETPGNGSGNLFLGIGQNQVLDTSYRRIVMQKLGVNWIQLCSNLSPAMYTYTGSGSPETVITAGAGSLYTNTTSVNGGATSLYVKRSGSGNTGWAPAYLAAGTTFATLPASPVLGMMVVVSDSNTATWGVGIAGGGTNKVLGYYNGTAWTVAGA